MTVRTAMTCPTFHDHGEPAVVGRNRQGLLRDNARIDADAASRLVQKLREFARTQLDEEERALLAILLAPGVARAYDEEETGGVTATDWNADALPRALAGALHDADVRVVGLERQ